MKYLSSTPPFAEFMVQNGNNSCKAHNHLHYIDLYIWKWFRSSRHIYTEPLLNQLADSTLCLFQLHSQQKETNTSNNGLNFVNLVKLKFMQFILITYIKNAIVCDNFPHFVLKETFRVKNYTSDVVIYKLFYIWKHMQGELHFAYVAFNNILLTSVKWTLLMSCSDDDMSACKFHLHLTIDLQFIHIYYHYTHSQNSKFLISAKFVDFAKKNRYIPFDSSFQGSTKLTYFEYVIFAFL